MDRLPVDIMYNQIIVRVLCYPRVSLLRDGPITVKEVWLYKYHIKRVLWLRQVHSTWRKAVDKCYPFWTLFYGTPIRAPDSTHTYYHCRLQHCKKALHYDKVRVPGNTFDDVLVQRKKKRKVKVTRRIKTLTNKRVKLDTQINDLEHELDMLE